MATSRAEAWKGLVWRRSVVVIALVTLFLSTMTFWCDELFPSLQRPHLDSIIHAIPWWCWAITGLVVIVVLVVEGALKLVNVSENQVEEYAKKEHSPNISIFLHCISLGSLAGRLDLTRLLTIVSVRNTGAPSIVDNWSMILDDFPEQRVERLTISEDVEWHYSNMTYKYSFEDHIHKKVAEDPVPLGGKRVGFMLWKLPGFNPMPFLTDKKARLRVTITARDVNGKLITAQDKASHHDDIGMYYPGLLGPKDRITPPE